jgi:glycosyltransferase involved in cell wall biosynthesis
VICGDEITTADTEASRLLIGVDVTGAEEDVVTQISEAIDRAIADDPIDAAQVRAAFVRERYAWSAAAEDYAALLDGLIAERKMAA